MQFDPNGRPRPGFHDCLGNGILQVFNDTDVSCLACMAAECSPHAVFLQQSWIEGAMHHGTFSCWEIRGSYTGNSWALFYSSVWVSSTWQFCWQKLCLGQTVKFTSQDKDTFNAYMKHTEKDSPAGANVSMSIAAVHPPTDDSEGGKQQQCL